MKKKAALPRPQQQRRELQRRLDNHFQACSVCAGAIALAVTSAEGGIVYSGPENIGVPFTSPSSPITGGLYIDLDTGTFSATGEVSGFDLSFSDVGSAGSAKLNFTGGAAAADGAYATITKTKHKGASSNSSSSTSTSSSTTSVNKIKAGTLIAAAEAFGHTGLLGTVSSSSPVDGFWDKAGTGYMGFQFVSAANTTLYGWVQLSVGADLTTTVVDWAYDDSGQPIVAGISQETSVRIRALRPTATAGGAAGEFKLVRDGDLTIPLKVFYSADSSSTAVSGTDYQPLRGVIVIKAGKKSALLPITAISNPVVSAPRTLTLNLTPGHGFDLAKPQATVLIFSGQ